MHTIDLPAFPLDSLLAGIAYCFVVLLIKYKNLFDKNSSAMSNVFSFKSDVFTNDLAGKKILFANFPADGHFNPLTGLAIHLQGLGCDVRWYTSSTYAEKIKKLQIHHYPFKLALEVKENNFDEVFPERARKKSQIAKLKFDMINVFVLRAPEYYADILEIQEDFNFDIMVADCAFPAIPFVKEKMNIPVIAVGIFPLTETSKDLPPAGLGMLPSTTSLGRIRQHILRALVNKFVFGGPNKVLWQLLDKYDIPHNRESIFDMLITKSDLFLQSGTPGFEYTRSDLGKNIRYIGALLPHSAGPKKLPWFDNRLTQYQQIVLVTQGTVEKDIEKILVPTLEAFKNGDTLVVATTGGSQTDELRKRFPEKNLIIEDFIPFGDIMPYADVYVTNGGYGGVMLSIENELPLVGAGIHEGKNEINARVGYFKLGINLKTEKPKPEQIRKAVQEVINNSVYKENVTRLAKEFSVYDPNELCAEYVQETLQKTGVLYMHRTQEEKIY
jgi:MGT family glycosyltransferase